MWFTGEAELEVNFDLMMSYIHKKSDLSHIWRDISVVWDKVNELEL